MSDREITDGETITMGGLTLCETRVYKWCEKGKDGKYRPLKPRPTKKREGWSPSPHLPEKPGAEWIPVGFSAPKEYYEAMIEGGPPDLDDILDDEMAEVIPIRPQEDE